MILCALLIYLNPVNIKVFKRKRTFFMDWPTYFSETYLDLVTDEQQLITTCRLPVNATTMGGRTTDEVILHSYKAML